MATHFIDELVHKVPTQLQNFGGSLLSPFHNNKTKWNQKKTMLPLSYQPGDWDVYCGRGKCNWNHKGNVRFRNLIQSNVQKYIDSPTRNDKTLVVISIVDYVRDRHGHFIKQQENGEYYDIGDAQARDKVGHSLRDQVTALQRQKKNKGAIHKINNNHNITSNNTDPEKQQHHRLSSSLSDSGNEMDLRKTTATDTTMLSSSHVRNQFERRPSFIIDSYQNFDSSQKRASILVSGDEQAQHSIMNSLKRSSANNNYNWEFLESLQDILDQVESGNFIDGIDHVDQQLYMDDVDDTPMRLSETVGTIEPFSLRESTGSSGNNNHLLLPDMALRESMYDNVPYGDFVKSSSSIDDDDDDDNIKLSSSSIAADAMEV